MKRLDQHLHLANRMIISNVWLLEDDAGRHFLIDTGHPLERPWLARSLWNAGIRMRGDLSAVILTHRHSDHAGNARWLREKFGCMVAIHKDDAPFLDGAMNPVPLARGVAAWPDELLCRIEDRFPARSPVDEVFEAGVWKHGFTIFHVPGHTEGSALLHHAPTGTLFSGDALLTGVPPLRAFEWLRLARPGYSLDAECCHAAVRQALAELPPTRAVAAGHGPLVHRDVTAKLLRLRR